MKLLLVDGNYYVYRSFFAIRELSNSRGEPTNAIYGFIKTIRRMLKDLQPDLGLVLWDEGLPERRTLLQPEYKQQRAAMPDLMIPQLAEIRNLVECLGLHSVAAPNTEADDLIACYAVQARAKGIQTVLATNDKDLFQLVDASVSIYSTNKADLQPGKTFALLGPEHVREKWGVEAHQIRDVLALTGDTVDNIPGVEGVGGKTAAKLILEFGSIDNLLANLPSIANEKLRERITGAAARIQQNLEMVSLDYSIPLPLPVEQARITPDPATLATHMRRYEFGSLLREVEAEVPHAAQQEELF